jgi:hypothetical protein
MMTRSMRKRLFYSLVAIFLLLGTGVIAYAEGWRIDFTTWHLEKVGEIFIRSYPDSATITINKKPFKNQSGFLSRGNLIPDLLPGTYDLLLAAPGYLPWHEKATVETSLVTQFKYTVLVPQNSTTVVQGPIADEGITNAGLVVKYANNIIKIGSTTVGAGTMLFSNHSNIDPWPHILIKNPKGIYSVYDPNTASSTNISSLFLENGIAIRATETVIQSRYGQNIVLAGNASSVSILNVDTGDLQFSKKASSGTAFGTSFATSPNGIAWATISTKRKNSFLNVYDPTSQTAETSQTGIPGKTIDIQWIQDNIFGTFQDDGSLYRYDAGTQTFTTVADNVRNFAASRDGVMLGALESTGLEAFNNTTGDYYRFNLPNADDIQKIIWTKDDAHIFIAYTDHVAFLDLTDRTLDNLITVSDGTSPVYDPTANALYIIDTNGDLLRFDFPD